MRSDKALPNPVRKAICLSLQTGVDADKTLGEWELALKFLVHSGQLRLTVNREQLNAAEIRLDWNAVPSEIAHYTAYLQSRDEYGGSIAYVDVWEGDRSSASQHVLAQIRESRKEVQAEAESDAKVALLQPRVCSLDGLFEAAELGNVEALKAMIRGYPMPTYDTNTGTFRPNADRLAMPQPKHVLRQTKQLSHTGSARQQNSSGARVAGDADEDLRQSAPWLFDSAGKLASTFDMRDAYGNTPLHIAAASGQGKAVKLLIQEGCDPNAPDRVAQTPLHLACLGGHKDVICALLKGGARTEQVIQNNIRSTQSHCTFEHVSKLLALQL
jgi:hypothetical protein